MQLSIIIPIYQVESTIERCLQSVLPQLGDDCELILVDDGSQDRSYDIAHEMTKGLNNCKIIRQRNGGLSAARNTGVKVATGKYLIFIDSDDFLAPDTIAPLMAIMQAHPDYDILEYPVYQYYGNPAKEQVLSFRSEVITSKTDYWVHGAYRHAYAWNKVYRRNLFTKVRFPEGKTFEDAYTYPRLLQQAQTVATTNCGMYYYCYNPEGITAKASGKDLTNLLEAHLVNLSLWQHLSTNYYATLVNIQMDVYEHTHAEPLLPLMPYWRKPKLILLHLVGMKRLCKLNELLHRWQKK